MGKTSRRNKINRVRQTTVKRRRTLRKKQREKSLKRMKRTAKKTNRIKYTGGSCLWRRRPRGVEYMEKGSRGAARSGTPEMEVEQISLVPDGSFHMGSQRDQLKDVEGIGLVPASPEPEIDSSFKIGAVLTYDREGPLPDGWTVRITSGNWIYSSDWKTQFVRPTETSPIATRQSSTSPLRAARPGSGDAVANQGSVPIATLNMMDPTAKLQYMHELSRAIGLQCECQVMAG